MAYINLGQVMYPIGAYYFSDSSVSPATLFGGTWTAIEAGKFICAADGTNWTAGEQGGNNWQTLTVDQIPNHSHYFSDTFTVGNNNRGTGASGIPADVPTWGGYAPADWFVCGGVKSEKRDQPFDNKPAYRATFIWYRTA